MCFSLSVLKVPPTSFPRCEAVGTARGQVSLQAPLLIDASPHLPAGTTLGFTSSQPSDRNCSTLGRSWPLVVLNREGPEAWVTRLAWSDGCPGNCSVSIRGVPRGQGSVTPPASPCTGNKAPGPFPSPQRWLRCLKTNTNFHFSLISCPLNGIWSCNSLHTQFAVSKFCWEITLDLAGVAAGLSFSFPVSGLREAVSMDSTSMSWEISSKAQTTFSSYYPVTDGV